MSKWWRKLDNTAKVFSVEEKNNQNTFRISVVLKATINAKLLKKAIIKALDNYPSFKVKLKNGLFWPYFEVNEKEPIVEKELETPCQNIVFKRNNDYLFKVTYFNKKINLDIFHVLTDGVGATIFFKEILYNYLNLKYKLKLNCIDKVKDLGIYQDEHLKNVDKKIVYKESLKKAYFIKQKSNLCINKTYHYVIDLKIFKQICKNNQVSISEYLTAIYIYAIYKTIYNKSSNKDIIVTIPIDLRRHFNVNSLTNFFTCMPLSGNVSKNSKLSFKMILNQVHQEFRNKLTFDNIKKYLARDVKLGNNLGIRLTPLFIKKIFMKHFEKLVNQTTTTVSNIGIIQIDDRYKRYIDNIFVLVNSGIAQKVKCTICSYENKLTVTLNSNLVDNKLEDEFYRLLVKYIGKVKLISNQI